MYQEINEYQFRDQFNAIRQDNFTYKGLTTLFNYFEELENDLGEKIELDVIAICCEYTEYKNLTEFNADYGQQYESIDKIEEDTTVLRTDNSGSFIIQGYWAYQAHLSGCVLLCLITKDKGVLQWN